MVEAPPNYDSVVNKMDNPIMHIVFDDTAAYPEYIIKFQQW